MELINEKRADMLFLTLGGRLDTEQAPPLEASLSKLIDEGARQLIIDCSRIEFINNDGLRVLLNLSRRILTLNGRIALHSLSPAARDSFEKTGFSIMTRIYDTREEAIAGIAGSGLLYRK